MNWENVAGNPKRVKKWFVRVGIFLPIISLLPALFFRHEALWIVGGGFGGAAFLFCFFVAFLLQVSVRKFEEVVAHIEDGEYIQKWTYTQEEWQKFATEELQRRGKKYQEVIAFTIGIFAISYVILACFSYGGKDFVSMSVICIAMLIVFVAIIFFAGRHREKRWQKNAIDHVDQDTLLAFIGPSFLLRGKEYRNFDEVGVELVNVKIENDNLVFKIEAQGNKRVEQELYILIPQGETQRAREIAAYFSKQKACLR